MNLTRRLEKVRGNGSPPAIIEEVPPNPFTASNGSNEPATLGRIHEAKTAETADALDVVELTQTGAVASGALGALKERASQALYERLGARITDSSLEEAELHQYRQRRAEDRRR